MATGQEQERARRRAVYIISVAAELAGVHPQTLRQYERKELIEPSRTSGNTRRYSDDDIERLRHIQEMTQQEGINLAGVRRVMELERRVLQLERDLERAIQEREEAISEAEKSARSRVALVKLTDARDLADS